MTEKEFYQQCVKSLEDRCYSLEASIRLTRSPNLKAFWTMRKSLAESALKIARSRVNGPHVQYDIYEG